MDKDHVFNANVNINDREYDDERGPHHEDIHALLRHILHELNHGHVTATEVDKWSVAIKDALANGELTQDEFNKFIQELNTLPGGSSMLGAEFMLG